MLLHKYVGLRGIDTIENRRLKADDPMAFNDPFELLITGVGEITPKLMKSRLTQEEFLEQLYVEYKMQHPEIDENEFKRQIEIAKSNEALLKQWMPSFTKGWKDELERQRRRTFKFFRIICFSAPGTDAEKEILMWAYYANGHQGMRFHIETDSIKKKSKVLGKINYEEEPITINLKEHLTSSYSERSKRIEQAVNESTFRKGLGWQHENEYRVLISPDECIEEKDGHGNILYFCEVDSQAIRQIDFGINCPKETLEQVVALISDNPDLKHIKLVKASVNNEKFEVIYDQIA